MTASTQNSDSLQLPSHIANISQFEPKADAISIYVTYEHQVFINKEEMRYWDNIVPTIMNIDRKHDVGHIFLSDIRIICDRRTKYRFVDQLKQELGRTFKKYFFYKIMAQNEESYLVEKNHGSLKGKWSIDPIRSRNHEGHSVRMIDSTVPQWMKTTEKSSNDELRQQFINYLYQGELSKVATLRKRHGSIHITLLPDKTYVIGNEILTLNELGHLNTYIHKGYIVFVRFDQEIDFEDYSSFLAAKKTQIKITPENFDSAGLFVEIPYALEEKLKEWQWQLFE